MAFKDILVHVDNSRAGRARLELAAWLAQAQQAHLIGLHVRTRTQMPAFVAGQLVPEIDALQDRFLGDAAAQARAAFDVLAPGAGTTREWRDVGGTLVETVTLHARYADISIVGQSEHGEEERPLADALVLEVGRPVLVVPYAGRFATVGERVLVAWNASREATRAVHDALPLLRRAARVQVLAINPDGDHGDIPSADIALHLSRHGVAATCEQVTADDLEVGALLLSRAADTGADLMVMGAYGRSRLRQLVLGGATRHILRHMTVPVLLSH